MFIKKLLNSTDFKMVFHEIDYQCLIGRDPTSLTPADWHNKETLDCA